MLALNSPALCHVFTEGTEEDSVVSIWANANYHHFLHVLKHFQSLKTQLHSNIYPDRSRCDHISPAFRNLYDM